jgi:transposase, IS5 family
MRFVDLAPHDAVPDGNTIWLFREQLTRAGALAQPFKRFDATLRERGHLAMSGQIVDATIIEARRTRLSKDEKAALHAGGTRPGWSKARARQIDRDGRWPIKHDRKPTPPPEGQQCQATTPIAMPVLGYKDHIGIDGAHGFTRRSTVTDAARHDGGQLGALLGPENTASDVWADTAYRSQETLVLLTRRGLTARFQRARPSGPPMPPHIARGNATRARVRSRVEHVFAAEKRRMRLMIRCIGRARATARITLANLVYNMRRLARFAGSTAAA